MPCRVDYDTLSDEERGSPELLKAAMCAILTTLTRQQTLAAVLKDTDWEEAGVSEEEVLGWWKRHQREDAARRIREAAAKEMKAVRRQAVAKLSAAERKALGL